MTDTKPTAEARYPGIHVEYFEAPRRRYAVNGSPAVSVTTALGILNKPALPHWSARVTAEGAWKMAHRKGYKMPDTSRQFIDDLKHHGYDHRSQTNAAAGRGVDVHAVWENWNSRKEIPNASDYPEDRRGYIRAMSKFIMEHQPACSESEIVVGSAEHGFAGRLDTVVVMGTQNGPAMIDVKTSKAVYPESHYPQLAGYELARRECGLPPTERQGILRVGTDGEYEVRWSDAEPEDFLCLLRAWRSQQRWARKR
ncbi:MAG: hypothetical protein JO130_18440 [Solirubrobacterales bacterium]|nr:hypothetical protein [Solirubrobacterales bacterium]